MHVDDTISANQALRLIHRGTALHWTGDYHNAKQLLAALGRRLPAPRSGSFHDQRQQQADRVRVLNALLVPMTNHQVELRRAPDVSKACAEAYGPPPDTHRDSSTSGSVDVRSPRERWVPLREPSTRWVPLRELLGVIGAHQLRVRGVYVPALGERIHPHYGVFAPTRSEYADLVAQHPLPFGSTAFDLGTGTGVLAAILSRRGIPQVIATDNNPRAAACARENLERLQVNAEVQETDLFPPDQADLIVCNPPWIPATPLTLLDQAVYDEDSRMLRAFLAGVRDHLKPGGEVWLLLSDLAEHLALRSRAELLSLIRAGGLQVAGRVDITPRHPRARNQEVTSLWHLK
ncbi:methyltransferase [Kribbella sp. NPDC048928]|uniref:methyltransferase n=1 Tax=Kribbella sp. NPDC048928 TaxID=3364111 RepID=UPI00371D1914